jgi:hypothetical protein
MLVPVGVSTSGHIKKIGTLVLVEDGHIKKKNNARRFMGTLKCSVTGRPTLGRQNPNKPFKIDFGVRGQSKRLVIIMDAY